MSYDEKALSEKLVVATVQSGKVDQNSRGVDLRESCQDRSQVQEQVAREECRQEAVAVALGIWNHARHRQPPIQRSVTASDKSKAFRSPAHGSLGPQHDKRSAFYRFHVQRYLRMRPVKVTCIPQHRREALTVTRTVDLLETCEV